MANQRPAVFLDRDGTLNQMVPGAEGPDSPFHPDELVLVRQAGPFVAGLNAMGYLCFVVTNQPGLARGKLSFERLHRIHERLQTDLARAGARIDGFYFCPHHPDPKPCVRPDLARECSCRKPAAGLLLQAAAEHGVDLRRSFMVGDRLTDADAGRRAGASTILVARHDPELATALRNAPGSRPDHITADLLGALATIRRRREAGADEHR